MQIPLRVLPFVVLLAIGSFACGDDDPEDTPPPSQLTEDVVLYKLELAYRTRRIADLTDLLAADYRFYLEPDTRARLGVEYWTRTQDSLATARLFASGEVKKIITSLRWPAHSATSAGFTAPRDTWTRLFLTDTFLDVDYLAPGQEINTYRVENQTQRFFFRRGRTDPPSGPGDTLVYIVEWHDDGRPDGLQSPNAVLPTTWSSIKALVIE